MNRFQQIALLQADKTTTFATMEEYMNWKRTNNA